MPINPNPQGKGLVPVLQSLGRDYPAGRIPPKQIDQIEMELFTSLFVLQSDFRFHPVAGNSYWLYQDQGDYRLLMVGPDEWQRTAYRGRFIGECMLQQDRTWTLELSPEMAQDQVFMAQLEQQRRDFQCGLEQAHSLEEVLPVYEETLGFYGRILAFSLGKSLGISMTLSGINALSYGEARGLLTQQKPD
jgi:hypothetical protein